MRDRTLYAMVVAVVFAVVALAQASRVNPPASMMPAGKMMVLAGKVTNISGDDITISALNDARFTETIHLDAATAAFKRSAPVARTILAIGDVIVARQVTSQGATRIVRVD